MHNIQLEIKAKENKVVQQKLKHVDQMNKLKLQITNIT